MKLNMPDERVCNSRKRLFGLDEDDSFKTINQLKYKYIFAVLNSLK